MANTYYKQTSGNLWSSRTPYDAWVVNPYNFIPFGSAASRSDIAQTYQNPKELLSGWMEIRITPRTDLILTDGVKDEKILKSGEKHLCYRFFQSNGLPAIPGSSLRGMLRSVYEAATNSCMLFSENDAYITVRRTQYQPMKNRALFGKNKACEWMLFPIEQPLREEVHDYRREIGKDGAWNGLTVGESTEKGWVQFQIPVAIKNGSFYHVSYLKEEGACVPLGREKGEILFRKLLNTAKETVDYDQHNGNISAAARAIHQKWVERLEAAAKDVTRRVPVWYQQDVNGNYYLSLSQIGRTALQKSWADLMKNYQPCEQPNAMCPACQLFGTTSLNAEQSARRGRLRFTDALPEDPEKAVDWSILSETLPILGGPKPSAFEFYVHADPKDHLFNKTIDDAKNARARGRKMYWHQGGEDRFGAEEGSMNNTMEVLRCGDGVAFTSRIYFDRITQEQLKQMQWVITLGDPPGGAHCHKLGHARPLGYGSVRLDLVKTVVRTFAKTESGVAPQLTEAIQEGGVSCPWNADRDPIKSLLAMTDFHALDSLQPKAYVAYPMKNKNGNAAVFNWFADNRMKGGNRKTLPAPTDPNKGLSTNVSYEEYSKAREEAAKGTDSGREAQPPRPQTANRNSNTSKPVPAAQNAATPGSGRRDLRGQTVTVTITEFKTYIGEFGNAAKCTAETGDDIYLVSRNGSLIDNYGLKKGSTVAVFIKYYDEEHRNWRAELRQ